MRIDKILFFGLMVAVLLQSEPLSRMGDDNNNSEILGQATQAYTTPTPPPSPVVVSPEYDIDPNIFSSLDKGMYLMGVDIDIQNINLFKYVDSIYMYNKLENKYVIKNTQTDKSIDIKAYSGFYVYNQISDKNDISFSLSAPKCTNIIPPIPPAPPLPKIEIEEDSPLPVSSITTYTDSGGGILPRMPKDTLSIKVALRMPKCPTLKGKLESLSDGWNLLGSSKEILNAKEVFKDMKHVYILDLNQSTSKFVDIQQNNILIKSNSGFWIYK